MDPGACRWVLHILIGAIACRRAIPRMIQQHSGLQGCAHIHVQVTSNGASYFDRAIAGALEPLISLLPCIIAQVHNYRGLRWRARMPIGVGAPYYDRAVA
jgi:hypothetical protein